jgi:hypothetical protein
MSDCRHPPAVHPVRTSFSTLKDQVASRFYALLCPRGNQDMTNPQHMHAAQYSIGGLRPKRELRD